MIDFFPNSVFIYFLLLGPFTQYSTGEKDYCKIKCANNHVSSGCNCEVSHKACKNPDTDKKITPSIVDFRKLMMKAHNELRNNLALGKEKRAGMQKGVADMRAIDYDLDLEYTARCWMNKCKYKHDLCRATPNFEFVGQNLYGASEMKSSDSDLTGAVKMWYEEIKEFTEESMNLTAANFGSANKLLNWTQIGHFSQVAWAQTHAVGCARYYDETAKWKFGMACNYGPAGNFLGKRMYTFGKACSQCGREKCNKEYKGLCGETSYDGNKNRGISNVSTKFFVMVMICVHVLVIKYI